MKKNELIEFLQRQNEFLQGRFDETPAPAISAESTSSTTSATSSTAAPHGLRTHPSRNTATCSLAAGKPHKNSRPKSGRLSFYGLPAIADGCTVAG